jgi:hypothetical protein
MDDPLNRELELVAALTLTAPPPAAWIEAAAMLPSTLGDLETIDRTIDDREFREQFARNPERTLIQAGLECTRSVLAAVRERLELD